MSYVKHLYKAESGIHGNGLYSTIDIEKGSFIGKFRGSKTNRNGMHVLWIYEDEESDEDRCEGYKITNILKYANHSNKPNTEVWGLDMYARKTIKAHKEITFDYGW